jgi:acylphosphatase
MKKAAILKVSGRVQNVGFRYHTRKTAEEYAISGFVRNMPDGSVYIECEGEEENLDRFILWCQQGPSWARVDHINIQNAPVQGYEGFQVK